MAGLVVPVIRAELDTPPPEPLRVVALPDGTLQVLGLSAGQAPDAAGWGIVSGSGKLTADTAPDGSPVLTLRLSADRRGDAGGDGLAHAAWQIR
jgi:hypothetical protein